jgi:hypothetical protein
MLAKFRIDDSDRVAAQIDWLGVALLTIAMTAIVWGLSQGNASGWSSANVVSALAAGVIVTLAFFASQRKASHALVPGRLLRSAQFRSGNVV